MQSPPPACVLRGHRKDVTAVRFAASTDSHGYPVLLSGAGDGELRIWSLHTHRSVAFKAAHSGHPLLGIHGVGDSHVLTQGRDGFVRTWDLRDGIRGPLLECDVTTFSFCQAVPVPDEDGAGPTQPLIAMPSPDAQEVVLWDSRQRRAARSLAPAVSRKRAGMCMCLRCVGPHVLLAGWEDGTLQLFDLRSTCRPEVRQLHSEPLLCLDVDPRARATITGAADCKVCVVPLRPRTAAGTPTGPDGATGGAGFSLGEPTQHAIPVTNESSGSGGIASVRVRPDGKVVASGGWDRRVRLWQCGRMKPLAVLRHHTATVNAVDFSPCSTWLASGSADGTVALWRGLYAG
jgi:WD40 repeat protein